MSIALCRWEKRPFCMPPPKNCSSGPRVRYWVVGPSPSSVVRQRFSSTIRVRSSGRYSPKRSGSLYTRSASAAVVSRK